MVIKPEEVTSRKLSDSEGMASDHSQSEDYSLDTVEKEWTERNKDLTAIKFLLTDCEVTSIPHLRAELLRLKSENTELRGRLKEQKSAELKEKESTDTSGNSSEGQSEMRKSLETLQPQTKEDCNVTKQRKKRNENTFCDALAGETPVATDNTADESANLTRRDPHCSRSWQHLAKHKAVVKSRLPVPVRMRADAVSSNSQLMDSGQLEADGRQRLPFEETHESDQQKPSSDSFSTVQQAVSPSATLRPAHRICNPAESNTESDLRASVDSTQSITELLSQVELLHQECQEKEALINKLTNQLSGWEEVHAQIQEKDRLNRQYVEALQAAESTIAYLTACSLDRQGGFVTQTAVTDVSVLNRYVELQKLLEEKEGLNHQLLKVLNTAEKAMASSDQQEGNPAGELCLRIQDALQQANGSSHKQTSKGVLEVSGCTLQELQLRADSLQEALVEGNKPRVVEAATQHSTSFKHKETSAKSPEDKDSQEQHDSPGGSENLSLNEEMIKVLLNCCDAAECAVASLAALCSNTSASASGRSQISPDLQMYLDKLQRALLMKEQLMETEQPVSKSSGLRSASSETSGQNLHQNLSLLHKAVTDYSQRICELQASLQDERRRKEESEVHKTSQDPTALPPAVQAQLEALHKELREKKKACRNLEEKLTTALTNTPSPETTRKDLEVGVNPSRSPSSLPSPLKHEQAVFSSNENLDSTSSTPYPTSPALSSAKVSLKNLQLYDEYGVSEDPLQLQGQVRELKVQLENQTRLILQMQSCLQISSLAGDPFASTSDPSCIRNHEATHREDRSTDKSSGNGRLREIKDGENQAVKHASPLNEDSEREKSLSRSAADQLQQSRSRSTSPARLDSLVQLQARELSQLRQQIKESRRLGGLYRRQLEELSKAFKELLQAGSVDYYVGEVVKDQLNRSLNILDKLEGRLDKGESHLDNEDVAALELSRRLAKELQEKNRLIQSLQSQIRAHSAGGHSASHPDMFHLEQTSCHGSPTAPAAGRAHSKTSRSHMEEISKGCRQPADWTGAYVPAVGGVQDEGVSAPLDTAGRLQGLQRENGRLQEQLRSSEELNATLRSELDLHRSIMAQNSSHHAEQDQTLDQDSGLQSDTHKEDGDSLKVASEQSHRVNPDLLAEHLQEIRALRRRLEESIRTNDRLREQLEKRLAEVEKDPAATNIFIHGSEEQGQLVNEVRYLWGQNQALREQLSLGSRDKQKENEKLRETLARRTAKLEHSRNECEALREENGRLLEQLENSSQENAQLQESLQFSKTELLRLQSEVTLQRQQLSDSQRLLQSLRVELQVHEKMKTESRNHPGGEAAQDPAAAASPSGAVDLSELLGEIRRLRLQLERSIQTNTALRQRLEEQLVRGPNRSDTININYLLSSPDEGGKSPGRDLPHRQSFQSGGEHAGVQHETDGGSFSSSSSDGVSAAPSRLVPGHRAWASRGGRHVLGLIEDYNALRKQVSKGRRLSCSMDTQLQECLHGADNKATEQQHLKSLSCSVNAMQQVLEEAGRLLKLLWRVSVPAGHAAGDENNQQDELLKNEISRLKSRLSQQEKMLSGAVKRLRSTNQMKEGMERVILDQLSLTHGVLKKARGNLEEVPVNGH